VTVNFIEPHVPTTNFETEESSSKDNKPPRWEPKPRAGAGSGSGGTKWRKRRGKDRAMDLFLVRLALLPIPAVHLSRLQQAATAPSNEGTAAA
jgi:hypothetical protein